MPRSIRHRVFKRFKYAVIPHFDEFNPPVISTNQDLTPLYNFFLSRSQRFQMEIPLQFELLQIDNYNLHISPPLIQRIPIIGRLSESLPSSILCFQRANQYLFGLFITNFSGLCLPLGLLHAIAYFSTMHTSRYAIPCQPAKTVVTPMDSIRSTTTRRDCRDLEPTILTPRIFRLINTTFNATQSFQTKTSVQSIWASSHSGNFLDLSRSSSLQISALEPHSLVFSSVCPITWLPPVTFFSPAHRAGIG